MTKKQTLSPEQDLAANPAENIWVQANAGTGKTSVLVQRLLRILFRCPNCKNTGILCLTYTNAGAGEMRNRILAALRKWAMSSDDELSDLLHGVAFSNIPSADDLVHARSIFFHYIDNPDILKIKTIHGFCEEILHRFPIEAGISPSWSLVSDSAQRILQQDAFTKMINSPAKSLNTYSAFEHLVERVSENYITDLLGILSELYKQFFDVNDIVKYRQYFIDTTSNFLKLKNIKNVGVDIKKLEEIIKIASDEQKSSKKPVKFLDDIINTTKQYINNTIDFEKYKTIYLTAQGTKKSTVSKRDFLIHEQNRVYEQNQQNENQTIFADTVALFDLGGAFAQQYKMLKAQKNLLDFDDLILYTRKLFSDKSTMGWILSQLDISLGYILVDEAQDTSPLQWDIMNMLSGDFFSDGDTSDMPRTMFVVGDTKQSIYGFQGADPHAFANSRDIISKQIKHNLRTIREVPLTQSFRSSAPVLNAVDKFFADKTVIAISNFSNNPHKCFRKNTRGAFEIHKIASKHETEITRLEYVKNIANKIKSLIDSGERAAQDIMILVQQRNPFAPLMVAELKRLNIDVAGSDRIVLPQFSAIKDLLNLLRWCINPTDNYSLCCVLRSPIFRLNQRDIFDLCTRRNNINSARFSAAQNTIPTTIYEQMQDSYPNEFAILEKIKTLSETVAPYSFFTSVLQTNNIRESFISALGDQVIDPIEEFLTICLSYERTQPGTLRHFLKWFITGNSEIKRDMDAANGVRIVTVHGSKGLEAPVVFLIDTTRVPKTENILPIPSKDFPAWIWVPRTNTSEHYNNANGALTQTRIEEYYRLLYVAMTRARDELYIYGYTTNKNASETSWHSQLWRVFANNNNTEYTRITNDDIA